MTGRRLIVMILSTILFYPAFLVNAYALNICTEGDKGDSFLKIVVDDFKDVPENNYVDCTYISSNGDGVYSLPLFVKKHKHPISFFVPYNALRFTIRTWENYSPLSGNFGNMIEESGWINQTEAGWPKKCVHEIPTY